MSQGSFFTVPAPAFKPSDEQVAIFEFARDGKGNLKIIARAGVGKTTTAVRLLSYVPEKSGIYCAFGRRDAAEITLKLKELGLDKKFKAQTLHSAGFGVVKSFWPSIGVSEEGERADLLTEKAVGNTAPDSVKRLITKLQSKAREICPNATDFDDLWDLAMMFDALPSDMQARDGFDDEFVIKSALKCLDLMSDRNLAHATGMDYADMIGLPVRNGWVRPRYPLVIIDEAQDMTAAQLELAMGLSSGRTFVIGDDRQCIYQFRGAKEDGLETAGQTLQAAELKLTKTFRCGRAIVAEANRFVPDLQAADSNPEGIVRTLPLNKLVEEAANGDWILSRTNAAIVDVAMGLLRARKRVRVAGKDIGKGLLTLTRKFGAATVDEWMEEVGIWRDRQVARLLAAGKESRIDAIKDKADVLLTIAEDCQTVFEINSILSTLFADTEPGATTDVITCSSVHRSKGREADRVYVLQATLRQGSLAEDNIAYVAITRAKKELVWVV